MWLESRVWLWMVVGCCLGGGGRLLIIGTDVIHWAVMRASARSVVQYALPVYAVHVT